MTLRPMTDADLILLNDVDAHVEGNQYLHLDRAGDGLEARWSLSLRPSRAIAPAPNPVGDDLAFQYKQVVSGADDGLALAAEHDEGLVAAVLARHDAEVGVVDLVDVRVDGEFRRQGLATAAVYQVTGYARDQDARAIRVAATADNVPFLTMLDKMGFAFSGLDVRRRTNHDLVKEQATLWWYLELEK